MGDLGGVYAVWLREFTVFKREKSRVVSALVQPLMWIFLFGGGIGGSFSGSASGLGLPPGYTYQQFIFPGIVMQSALFSSMFFGLYIVWDRKIDVLKEVLVSPVSRPAIFFGKVLGGCTDVMIQTSVLLVIGYFLLGMPGPGYAGTFLLALGVVFLAAIGTVSIGLTLGSLFESLEGFQVVITFLAFPLFFLSAGLFPLNPALQTAQPAIFYVAHGNPITYPVDALHAVILGWSAFHPAVSVAVTAGFALLMVGVGTLAFNRMKL